LYSVIPALHALTTTNVLGMAYLGLIGTAFFYGSAD
jgi:hypothetical protein